MCIKRCCHCFKRRTKILIKISVRDLRNYMIKLYDYCGWASVVDSVTHKLLISDTTLRSFIPPQVCEITTKLCQICVCGI